MSNSTTAAKFWIALLIGFVGWYRVYVGVDLGLDEATATGIVNSLIAAFVWLIPNRPKS